MIRIFGIFITAFLLTTGTAYAVDEVDAAAKQLQTDADKLNADIAADADKKVLVADKQKIKTDKAALKAARQGAKSEMIKGNKAGDRAQDQPF